MSIIQQRTDLQSKIWKMAEEVRGTVDGWDFKHFVLGTLFYRCISEHFSKYMEVDDGDEYAKKDDTEIALETIATAVNDKGYFIYPSQLFVNVATRAHNNPNLNQDLLEIFSAIESSAKGYLSENNLKGLFADFDTTSTRLGSTAHDRNKTLVVVIKGVASFDFNTTEESQIDLFGDAYEFLISKYADNAGKSGGEFFTPQHVSKLVAQIAMHKQSTINKIYDPAVGSGSLLLQSKKHFDSHMITEGFFGQELNHTTYNLARMNMFFHNIHYEKFKITWGNTLLHPHFMDEKPFDVIVSNPPYSIRWIGSDDPSLIKDERFAPAGVLAPPSKGDFAFILHCLHYLSKKGRAVIVSFPGIFYRLGAEKHIRQYLVDLNVIETIIALPPNLFYGTITAVNILVLSKHKKDRDIYFVDASGEEFFMKDVNNNVLLDEHIDKIMDIFDERKDIKNVSKLVEHSEIASKDYNLSVGTYVENTDERRTIDVSKLQIDISKRVSNIERLRAEIESLQLGKFIEGTFQEPDVTWSVMGDQEYIEIANTARKAVKKSLRIFGDNPYYGANNIQGYVQGYTHDGEYILIAEDGSASLINYSIQLTKDRFWANNHVHVVRAKGALNNKFLYYYLQTINFRPFLSGGLRAKLTKGNLINIPIVIPPLATQNEIVRRLDIFTELSSELSSELSAERTARNIQYEYYRNQLLNFSK